MLDRRRTAPEDARTRLLHRPGVHDQGRGHRGDRHARRRTARRRRRRRALPDRRSARASARCRRTSRARNARVPSPAWRRTSSASSASALGRGDVLAMPGDVASHARLRGTPATRARALTAPITARGAFKLYVGAAEVDARLRLYGTTKLEPGDGSVRADHDVARRWCWTSATGSSSARPDEAETVAGASVLDVGTAGQGRRRPRRAAGGPRVAPRVTSSPRCWSKNAVRSARRRCTILTGSRAHRRSRGRRVARGRRPPRGGARRPWSRRSPRSTPSIRWTRAPISTLARRAVAAVLRAARAPDRRASSPTRSSTT